MEISGLPRDVLLDILMRLPVKPLIRFSLSSKRYLSLIHHPQFINRHLTTRSKINPSPDDNFILLCYYIEHSKVYSICSFTDGGRTIIEHERSPLPLKFENDVYRVKIVGSSNGLVCLSDTAIDPALDDSIILWNVIIRKSIKLPNLYLSPHIYRVSLSHVSIGFGFVLETSDFKVVQIMYFGGKDKDQIPDVFVYSMELNTWRKIEANIELCPDNRFRDSNVYVNGAVHWLAHSDKKAMVGSCRYSIMSFDMRDEVFREMVFPNSCGNGRFLSEMTASACGETLSLFLKVDNQWEVWLMKEYGMVDSWTRQFCIAVEMILRPLKVMENGDVLLAILSRSLVLWDAKSQQLKDLVLCDADQKMKNLGIDPLVDPFRIVTYTSSLSLLDRGEKVLDYKTILRGKYV